MAGSHRGIVQRPVSMDRLPFLRSRGGTSTSTASSMSSASTTGRQHYPPIARQGTRSIQPGICRYESLDSLQHLSTDGFLRSWLPSYSNIAKVVNATGSSNGSATKYCYISVYKVHVPKWYKLLSVSAGRVMADYFSTPSNAGCAQSATVSPAPSSPAVMGISEQVEQASHQGNIMRPDERKGTLSLLHSTEDENIFKLVWCERPSSDAASYPSIFTSESQRTSSLDGTHDLAAAELEINLSATRSFFK